MKNNLLRNVVMLKFHDVQQNSDEWYQLRAGKITSSALACVMANYGKAFGEPAKKYAYSVAVEQLTGKKIESDSYSNDHMQRGHDQEPIARMAYEEEMFCDVLNGGFFVNGSAGASPDGLVSSVGLIEIKSAIPSMHVKRIKSGTYDSAYKWQLIGNLKLTERQWIDFISYCADFPEGKRIYVRRLYAEQVQKEFEMIDTRLKEFFELVETTKEIISSTNMIEINQTTKVAA